MSARWVRDRMHPHLEHLNGVPWDKARLPHTWHRCRPQTRGTYNRWHNSHDRCACGAKRRWGVLIRGSWVGKNSRRQRVALSGADK